MKPPLKNLNYYDEKKELDKCIKCKSDSFHEKAKGWLCASCHVFYDEVFFSRKPEVSYKGLYEGDKWG